MTDDLTARVAKARKTMPGAVQGLLSSAVKLRHDAAVETLLLYEEERQRLLADLAELTEACVCGCPDDDHEAHEDGESCLHDDHDCIQTCRAVAQIVAGLREERQTLAGKLWTALEERDHARSLLAALSPYTQAPALARAIRERDRAREAVEEVRAEAALSVTDREWGSFDDQWAQEALADEVQS